MGSRRKARQYLLQMLFQSDMGKQSTDEVRRTFWTGRDEPSAEVRGFADDLFRIAGERHQEIDALIEANARHWRMERMAAVDRNLLRAAVAEFLAHPRTPKEIVINEALEIAHKFSTPESLNFINGVLDSVARNLGSRT
jgi:N utilization substance protein B